MTALSIGLVNFFGKQDIPRMSPSEALDRLEQLLASATPEPWYVVGPPWNDNAPWIRSHTEDPHGLGHFVCDFVDMSAEEQEQPNSQTDAASIVHLHNLAPLLIEIAWWMNEMVECALALPGTTPQGEAWKRLAALARAMEEAGL